MTKQISLQGLFTDNLKGIDLEIPLAGITTFSGPAGAGKSALVLRTLLAVSQARYLESGLSGQASFFTSGNSARHLSIKGLPAAVFLRLRGGRLEKRYWSQVIGLDVYLATLFSARAEFRCPQCGQLSRPLTLSAALAEALELPGPRLTVSFPSRLPTRELITRGFSCLSKGTRPGPITAKTDDQALKLVFVDEINRENELNERLYEALAAVRAIKSPAVRISNGKQEILLALGPTCPACLLPAFPAREKLFYPDRGERAKKELGSVIEANSTEPPASFRPEALLFCWSGHSIADLWALTIAGLDDFLAPKPVKGQQQNQAVLQGELLCMLDLLRELGLADLPLARPLAALSPTEQSRVLRLPLLADPPNDMLLVLEHPAAGLPSSELPLLADFFQHLAKNGNTVVMVENHPALTTQADQRFYLGPGGGRDGGRLLSSTTDADPPSRNCFPDPCPKNPVFLIERAGLGKKGLLLAAKSIIDNLELIRRIVYCRPLDSRPTRSRETLGDFFGLRKELGKTFARQKQARLLGFLPGHFSPFSSRGRCPACRGRGHVDLTAIKPGVFSLKCPDCAGSGFNPGILRVRWRGLTIAEVLACPMADWLEQSETSLRAKLCPGEVFLLGLQHLSLGRRLSELSAGEWQKICLLGALAQAPAPTLFLLDTPGDCLTRSEIRALAEFLARRADLGHFIVCADEHPAWTAQSELTVKIAAPDPDKNRFIDQDIRGESK